MKCIKVLVLCAGLLLVFTGLLQAEPSYSEALVQRAKSGDAEAQYDLGWVYYEGEGVIQDYKEAVKWFRLAAEQGDAPAQCSLGYMYGNGDGVIQDYKEAAKWCRLAAEQGDASAQHNLGWMYGKGEGVIQDYKESYFWFLIATANGHEDAKKGREILVKELSKQQKEQIQARATKWFDEHN